MRFVNALAMIGERVDDAATGDDAVTRCLDHPRDLLPQCGKLGDFLIDVGEMRARDRIDIGAGLLRLVR